MLMICNFIMEINGPLRKMPQRENKSLADPLPYCLMDFRNVTQRIE